MRIPGIRSVKKAIYKAVALGNELGHIFVATSDAKGLPHLAASGKISLEENGQIGVSEWFCPGTLSNIQVNPRMSIVVWDPKTDKGFPMLGNCEKVEDMSVMDGFLLQGAHVQVLDKKDFLGDLMGRNASRPQTATEATGGGLRRI